MQLKDEVRVRSGRSRPCQSRSPRRLSPTLRQHVIELYQTTYRGLNHQHFCELLREREHIMLSISSVRRILRSARRAAHTEDDLRAVAAGANFFAMLRRKYEETRLDLRKTGVLSPTGA